MRSADTGWADDKWELYDQDNDFTQAHDLASAQPERLKAMIDLWWAEARRHQVLPVDIGVGNVRLLVDGSIVASRERVRTAPMGHSNVIEGLQIGRGWGTPAAFEHYHDSFPFTGRLRGVELQTDLGSQLRRSSFADPGDVR